MALMPPAEPLTEAAIDALMRFVARRCYWTIESFDWRIVHRTYHQCTAENDGRKFTLLIGADAPIVALSERRNDGMWSFFNDPAIAPAMNDYYGPALGVLDAVELRADLTERDRSWLASLGKAMQYDLQYWNPRTVGEVVFNYWD